LEKRSAASLFRELRKLDPVTAESLDAKNKRRIIRALEVCIKTGKPFSALREKGEPLFDALLVGIRIPRQKLYARIDARVDAQMRAGWLQETEAVLKKLRRRMPEREIWKLPGMGGLGYRELGTYLRGETTLPEAVARVKRDTRRYAKRQLTWWRRDGYIRWVRTGSGAERLVRQFLAKH
jgi:tRNA dimethylallyltransferase